jgi:glycerol-3-phosphate dehydrogenase
MAAFFARFTAEAAALGCSPQTIDHLIRTYGSRAETVLSLAVTDPSLREVVSAETGAIAAEVVCAVREELAEDLTDILLRRTMAGLGCDAGFGAIDAAAGVAILHLGWDNARAGAEIANYRDYIERVTPHA